MNADDFDRFFAALTGNRPLSWQKRLHREHFVDGKLPPVIDLPTGLGKTMIMAIWLIARAQESTKVPTRLIYVVDRRTVVDQATDLADELRKMLAPQDEKDEEKIKQRKRDHAGVLSELRQALGGSGLAISTLRGQLADNREWSRDPSKPAIIIGTVDLIGSALLFSGYRSSYKRRPLEAGLLGQDSLLVLDEAHLSKPFEKLLTSISDFQKDRGQPMQVIRMSATSSTDSMIDVFRLKGDFDSRAGDFADDTIYKRYKSTKRLTINPPVEKGKLNDKLATEAVRLAEDASLRGKRIVVFVRKPDDARAIARAIGEHGSTKSKSGPYDKSVEVLTGTMRGLERDELVEKPVLKRFLDGDENPDLDDNRKPVFLISTSAGEVGFDLNADHMVCDATTIDSLIQRLGRVNRRGANDATIILIKEIKPADKTDFDRACIATLELLTDQMDVSPKGLAAFKKLLTPEQLKAASTPEPTMVELTDILLDAWSMTSIVEPMPGRPAVGPWLRGIAEWVPPQTTIAWRAELDEPGFEALERDQIEEWFDTHRILPHETLGEKTTEVAAWFVKRWDEIPEPLRRELGDRLVIIDRAGTEVVPLDEVIKRLSRKSADSDAFFRHAEIIVPASFGGIRRSHGLLDHTEPKLDQAELKSPPEEQNSILKTRRESIDVADIAPDRIRQRVVETTLDGEKQEPRTIGGGQKPDLKASLRVDLDSDDDKTVRLVSHIPRRDKQEFGSEKQTLFQHVDSVDKRMIGILSRLPLPIEISPIIRLAARLAARSHDHGKNRLFFQRTVGGLQTETVEQWQAQTTLEGDGKHQCLGKSGGEMKRDSRGYRHEFGSLREFDDAFNADQLLDDSGKPIAADVFDLTMHLIATHHGRGRPHFPKGGFDPACESRSDEIHNEALRRYARLQRQYGWWQLAWLENLLRCADALASADADADEESDGSTDQPGDAR